MDKKQKVCEGLQHRKPRRSSTIVGSAILKIKISGPYVMNCYLSRTDFDEIERVFNTSAFTMYTIFKKNLS